MKIALIIYGSIEQKSGGYYYDRRVFHYLIRQGHEVKIFPQKYRNFFFSLLENINVGFIARLLAFQPQLILEDELNHSSLFLLNSFINRRRDCKLISIVHHLKYLESGRGSFRQVLKTIEARFIGTLDGVIANSRSTLESLRRLGLKESLPQVIARPGKDRFRLTLRRPAPYSLPLKLLFLGAVSPRKNLAGLIKVLREIPPEKWLLTIIGKFNPQERYCAGILRQIREWGLERSITLRGYQNDQAVSEALENHHLFVMPSFLEGYGIAYLDALQAFTPVIGSNRGGAREIIEPGVNGYLVNPHNPAELHRILSQLLSAEQLYSRLAKNSRETWLRFDSWAGCLKKIETFILSLR